MVSPQWTYRPDADALTGMSSVQLLIWPAGICISGHGEDGTTMIARAFSFEEHMAAEVMNAIFMNEPLLAGPQPINKIWIAETRTLLVPSELYNKDMARGWLSAIHYIEEDEQVLCTETEGGNIYALFPIRQNLQMALQQFFPEGKTGTFSNRLINCKQKADLPFTADIILLGRMAMLSFEQKDNLLAQQFFAYETTEDIIYRIAEVAEMYKYSVADTAVMISGVLADITEISREISAFYPRTQLCDNTTTLNFLTKLSLCAL